MLNQFKVTYYSEGQDLRVPNPDGTTQPFLFKGGEAGGQTISLLGGSGGFNDSFASGSPDDPFPGGGGDTSSGDDGGDGVVRIWLHK